MAKVWIQSIGCQMSVHDGQRVADMLGEQGYERAMAVSDADVIVLTTCSVREKAHQKVLSAIGRFRRLKERRPELLVVVAGCVAQQEGENLLQMAPQVDIVVGPDHLWRVPYLVEEIKDGGERRACVGFQNPDHGKFLGLAASCATSCSAYLTIQKGCNQWCAFCIVPTVRGPAECRPNDEILAEAEGLVGRGARELVLLGQTVNSYRFGDTSFAELLTALDGIDGLDRIRYESAHPKFLDDEVVEAHASLSSLCEHLHLPVQSGSDPVLERMGRGHDRAQFVGWIERLRGVNRSIGFTTDLFVGFPGEREEDFLETMSLVEEVGFDASYSFKYSPRPGTRAADWDDDVQTEVKIDRLRRLQDLQADVTEKYLTGLIGTTVEVLVEGESKVGGGQLRGRSRRNTVVNIDPPESTRSSPPQVGDIVEVALGSAGGHSVRGSLPHRHTKEDGADGSARDAG